MNDGDHKKLESQILEAHNASDSDALWRLYRIAAASADDAGDEERAAFFLTHAWVFALDAASASASDLFDELRARGRA